MNAKEKRCIALGATRSYLRSMGIEPTTINTNQALAALDDISRRDKTTIAAAFYQQATDNQIRLFCKEWKHNG